MRSLITFGLLATLLTSVSACSLQASASRVFDPDAEFAKLDGPEVDGVQSSLEKNAVTALEDGQNDRALSFYKQLLEKNPEESRFQLGMAESLRRVGQYDQSLRYYEQVIKKDAAHVDAHEGKALALMSLGQPEEAGRIFTQIMERDPQRWRTLNALGILFVVKNMQNEGKAYFNEALKFSPSNPSVMNNIGLTQAIMRDYRPAILSLQAASRTAENLQRQQVDMNLAMVYGVSGDSEAARKIASKYMTGAALDNNLGLYAHLANNDEMAKTYLNMALSGSTTYYKRAWQNLDIITRESQTEHAPIPGQKSFKVQ